MKQLGSSGEGAVALEGKGREGKGREEALAGADAPPAGDEKASGPGPVDLLRLWNELKPAACAKASALSDQRKAAAAARIREHQPDPLGWWRGILAAVNGSALLRGEKSEWRADFDWLLKPANLLKVQEGKYADHTPRARAPADAAIGKPVETVAKCELCGKDTPSLVWGHPCCTECRAVAFERAKALGTFSQASFDAAFRGGANA